ncbi:MAG: TRAP transporter small permease [Hydrogenophaga sp.]|nr:TRAP transporter small permease [Hydrogenophaga sp.]
MVVALAAMVVMVFGNVVLRYGFNSGITVSEELSRWLFVWMTFLGAFVAMHTRRHLGTDVVVGRLPLAGRKVCFVISRLAMLFVCWLVVRGGWEQVVINRATRSAVTETSMAFFYLSGVVFGALACVVLLNELWQVFSGRADESLFGIAGSEDAP